MLVVCGLPTLTDNLARAKSYSERMFQAELLDALRPPEDGLAFTRPIQAAGHSVDTGVVESVRRDTGGYPFHIQFFGALLWEACSPSATITNLDFERHRPTILRALDGAFFDARLARTSGLERRVLGAVAAGGEVASLQSVREGVNLPNRRMQPLIAELETKGLLYRPERGRLAFTVRCSAITCGAIEVQPDERDRLRSALRCMSRRRTLRQETQLLPSRSMRRLR